MHLNEQIVSELIYIYIYWTITVVKTELYNNNY